jgi:hypothetical protein
MQHCCIYNSSEQMGSTKLATLIVLKTSLEGSQVTEQACQCTALPKYFLSFGETVC